LTPKTGHPSPQNHQKKRHLRLRRAHLGALSEAKVQQHRGEGGGALEKLLAVSMVFPCFAGENPQKNPFFLHVLLGKNPSKNHGKSPSNHQNHGKTLEKTLEKPRLSHLDGVPRCPAAAKVQQRAAEALAHDA